MNSVNGVEGSVQILEFESLVGMGRSLVPSQVAHLPDPSDRHTMH